MRVVEFILITFMIVCAVAVAVTPGLLTSIVILSSYSLIMSVVWMLLESPDLAITEAAVGAGVTSVLFYITLRRIHAIDKGEKDEDSEE